jgi:2,5-diketo-D-gluconate reductase B
MKYVNAGGVEVAALGLGTWDLRGAVCTRMVRFALDLGYRHIDTAQMYENEAEVGAGIKESRVARDDIFLTTKTLPDLLAHDDLKRSTEESLARLGTDYVDLLLIHWPNDAIPMAESFAALAELRAEGKVRHIGVSNFTLAHMKEAVEKHGAPIVCNQVEYHPYLSQKTVLGYLREKGLMLTAYTPIAKGDVMRDPVLVDIAAKYGKTPAQITLGWLVGQEGVSAIPATTREAHCQANFEVFDFELTPDDDSAIHALARGKRYVDSVEMPVQWDVD